MTKERGKTVESNSNARKLKFPKSIDLTTGITPPIFNEPVMLSAEINGNVLSRLVKSVRVAMAKPDYNGNVKYAMLITNEDNRVVDYPINNPGSLVFNENTGTASFTTYDGTRRYTVRAIQDSDEITYASSNRDNNNKESNEDQE